MVRIYLGGLFLFSLFAGFALGQGMIPIREFGLGQLASCALSPDGTKYLTGSQDGRARLWNAVTGQLLKTFDKQPSAVNAVTFSPDSSRILIGASNSVIIYEASTFHYLTALGGHSDEVWSVAISADNSRILTGSKDRTAKLWKLVGGLYQADQTFSRSSGQGVKTLAFSADASRILIHWNYARAEVRDAATGNILFFDPYAGPSAALSSDGKKLLVGTYNQALLYDVDSQKILKYFPVGSPVNSVAFSPDGTKVATGSGDLAPAEALTTECAGRIWDAVSGTLLHNLQGHTAPLTFVSFMPNSQTVISTSADNTVRFWDNGSNTRTFSDHSNGGLIARTPDGTKMMTSGATDFIPRLWDLQTGDLLYKLTDHKSYVYSINFSNDGTKVLIASRDGSAKVFETATGNLIKTFSSVPDDFRFAAFSSDGSRIFGGTNSYLKSWWWSYDSGEKTKNVDLQVTFGAMSPDTNRIFASYGGSAKLWDLVNEKSLLYCGSNASAIDYSSDGKTLLTCGFQVVQLYSAETFSLLHTMWGHSSEVTTGVFSPNGQYAATGGYDSKICVWDVVTGQMAKSIPQSHGILSLEFMPDNVTILCSTRKGTVTMWAPGWDAAQDWIRYR